MPLTLYDLPHTAWDRVAFFLSDDVDTLLQLSSMSRSLQAICRLYTSAHFRKAVRRTFSKHEWLKYDRHDLRWANHSMVHMILNGDLDPTQIFEYQSCERHVDYDAGNIKETVYYDAGQPKWKAEVQRYYNRFTPTTTTRPGLPRPGFESPTPDQINAYDKLVISAIESSRWILPERRSEIFERFRTGDIDAAGLILLPLLTHLKAVEPPVPGGLCAELFRQVAHEHRSQDQRGVRQSDILPFSELLILYVEPEENRCVTNFWLHEIRPFMSIQSLRRIVLHGMRDWSLDDDWPSNCVPITCPEIYFAQSSVDSKTIKQFGEDIAGPCTLMQWYEIDVYYQPSETAYMGWEPDWDHLYVAKTESGDRKMWTSLQCDGGVMIGHELPWVSWLWHRKMQDWELLEEPFHNHDGDENHLELTGWL